MAFLEIDGFTNRFGSLEILKGIDLTLDKGGFLVLVGPSGCGKSTLLNTIAGLERSATGEIRIDGTSINDLHPSKRDIAMVFQSYALYPNMIVAQNMAFGMEMRGVPKARTRRGGSPRSPRRCRSSPLLSAGRASSPAASASASRWAARWCASRASSCSTSLCPISTPNCASTCASRSSAFISDRNDDRLCHARPDRGDDAGDPDCGAEGRRVAAGRKPERDLQQPGQSLRRRLHGFAGDEPDAGHGDAGERPCLRHAGARRRGSDRIACPRRRRRRQTHRRPRRHHGHSPRSGHRPRWRRSPFQGHIQGSTRHSRSSSRQAPTRSSSPASPARRSPLACAPTLTSSPAIRFLSPSTSTRRCCSIRRRA